MSPNFIQEQLSWAYVRAAVFSTGFNLSIPAVDDHGIDGTIQFYQPSRKRVDFQLKSTTRYSIRNGNIIYDLRAENYNQLIDTTDNPQVLILFVMSANSKLWVSQDQYEMCLRKAAYWVSLMGRQRSDNLETVRVEVPLANIFDRNGIQNMFNQL